MSSHKEYLQEADAHEDEGVRRDATGENFVEVTLQQKLLQHHHETGQVRVLLLETTRHRS